MGLLVENPVYKPFRYPWCYDAWLTQQRIHWLQEEVPLGDDVRDWQDFFVELNAKEIKIICNHFIKYQQKENDNLIESLYEKLSDFDNHYNQDKTYIQHYTG